MRLWLDDTRPAPPGWTWVTTVDEMIDYLAGGDVDEISLDHDLNETDGSRKGLEVLHWLEEAMEHGYGDAPVIHFHTANFIGGARMARSWSRIESRHGLSWLRKELLQ